MKTLKQILEVYKPKSADEKKFVDKHIVVKHKDRNGNGDDVFQAANVKTIGRKKERHGYDPNEDEKVYEEVEYVEEKLKVSDGVGKWISDFVHSDNPKFAGKSKKERTQMALGAFYSAKRGE